MSAETNTGTTTPGTETTTTSLPEDPIKQLKGEFNRKLGETNKLIEQMAQTNAQLSQQLQSIVNPKAAPAKEEPLERLMYSDPKKYTAIVTEQAKQQALAEMRTESQSQGAVQAKIAALASEYPELSDQNSDLTKASVELLKAANAIQMKDPSTYEHAVLKAAQQLDVKPRSKRPKTEDDFVPASYASPQNRRTRKTEESVIKEGKESAAAFGINLDDPKTKERYIKLLKSKGMV